ncbi:MAG: adenylyl-sulfate kinase [Bacteroidetes bacterium]|nr:adenylyl-sulfate kinase [Bacteroidota bacterium]
MEKNIIPHRHSITKSDRHRANKHRSLVIWFTGLSGSGKSTLAGKVEALLFKEGIKTYILDGDNVRTGLNKNLSFSPEDRKENIRRIGEAAKLFVDAGVVVLTAFISPYREDRNSVRKLLDKNEFIEVYVKCPVEICEQRDVKGLYAKARKGEIKDFTGINAPYEEPENPEITIETNLASEEACAWKIYQRVIELIRIKS